jgi:Kazal-type serine protease inhibitor domain
MHSTISTLAAVSSFTLMALASACASNPESIDSNDDTVEASESELTASQNLGYYIVTSRDYRRCVSPICGGLFVKRVNAVATRCADGSFQTSCYVGEIDTTALGLTGDDLQTFKDELSAGRAIVRANPMSFIIANQQRIGRLVASEAWLSQGPAAPSSSTAPAAGNTLPSGTFMRVKDIGLRCFRAPCPSTRAFKLNTYATRSLTDLSLNGAGASATQVDAAGSALFTDEGLLLAGTVASGPQGAVTATANQFYLKVKPSLVVAQACGGRGLGFCPTGLDCIHPEGALCGRADAPGRCQVRPVACNKALFPVCGCDGNTYGNACLANLLGISVDHTGACPPAPPAPCAVGGCSGQLCSDQPGLVSTCEFRPRYACFQGATCERQSNGSCGWTATPALNACLAANP